MHECMNAQMQFTCAFASACHCRLSLEGITNSPLYLPVSTTYRHAQTQTRTETERRSLPPSLPFSLNQRHGRRAAGALAGAGRAGALHLTTTSHQCLEERNARVHACTSMYAGMHMRMRSARVHSFMPMRAHPCLSGAVAADEAVVPQVSGRRHAARGCVVPTASACRPRAVTPAQQNTTKSSAGNGVSCTRGGVLSCRFFRAMHDGPRCCLRGPRNVRKPRTSSLLATSRATASARSRSLSAVGSAWL